MKKTKNQKKTESSVQSQPNLDLEQKQSLAGQVARAHDLLVYGTFQGSLAKDVLDSREFLTQLHEQMLKEIEQLDVKSEQVPEQK